jgi:DNA modification methylase
MVTSSVTKNLLPDARIIFGDMRYATKEDIGDKEVALIVTSPPYYNAPFDYPDFFPSYDAYLTLLKDFAKLSRRVLAPGRLACIVTDDMLVAEKNSSRSKRYPIVADTTRAFIDEGFIYRDRIVWVKPKGYVRISHRSGVVLQHPYPMYFYPDNICETILIFQNGYYDYHDRADLEQRVVEASKIDTRTLNSDGWAFSVWNITNVLPMKGRLEEGIAAFPVELAERLVKLFSYVGEVVLDPFLGSGTTARAALKLRRKFIGIEIDKALQEVIQKKLDIGDSRMNVELKVRRGALTLRSAYSGSRRP